MKMRNHALRLARELLCNASNGPRVPAKTADLFCALPGYMRIDPTTVLFWFVFRDM